jgi:hypothetical protein
MMASSLASRSWSRSEEKKKSHITFFYSVVLHGMGAYREEGVGEIGHD